MPLIGRLILCRIFEENLIAYIPLEETYLCSLHLPLQPSLERRFSAVCGPSLCGSSHAEVGEKMV